MLAFSSNIDLMSRKTRKRDQKSQNEIERIIFVFQDFVCGHDNLHYSAWASFFAACRGIWDTKIETVLLLESVESGTNDVNFQCCPVKCMVVESEVLKALNCALRKFSLPMHSYVIVSRSRQCDCNLFETS